VRARLYPTLTAAPAGAAAAPARPAPPCRARARAAPQRAASAVRPRAAQAGTRPLRGRASTALRTARWRWRSARRCGRACSPRRRRAASTAGASTATRRLPSSCACAAASWVRAGGRPDVCRPGRAMRTLFTRLAERLSMRPAGHSQRDTRAARSSALQCRVCGFAPKGLSQAQRCTRGWAAAAGARAPAGLFARGDAQARKLRRLVVDLQAPATPLAAPAPAPGDLNAEQQAAVDRRARSLCQSPGGNLAGQPCRRHPRAV